jgi:hypothetical protein
VTGAVLDHAPREIFPGGRPAAKARSARRNQSLTGEPAEAEAELRRRRPGDPGAGRGSGHLALADREGYALTIDHGWAEVAQTALAFIRASPEAAIVGRRSMTVKAGSGDCGVCQPLRPQNRLIASNVSGKF